MTKEQFELYSKIEYEIKDVRNFCFWCGNKYRNKYINKNRFNIVTKFKNIFLYKKSHVNTKEENTFNIPIELQERIIEVVENYLDEKEEELRKI